MFGLSRSLKILAVVGVFSCGAAALGCGTPPDDAADAGSTPTSPTSDADDQACELMQAPTGQPVTATELFAEAPDISAPDQRWDVTLLPLRDGTHTGFLAFRSDEPREHAIYTDDRTIFVIRNEQDGLITADNPGLEAWSGPCTEVFNRRIFPFVAGRLEIDFSLNDEQEASLVIVPLGL